MRKSSSRILTSLSVMVLLFVTEFFSACSGVIFDTIRDEVKLADASVSGDIQNIVRYKYNGEECIFASTGEIYYRSVEGDNINKKISFSEFSSPSGFVYSLAADSTYLYALSATIEKDDDGYNVITKRTLWRHDGTSWTELKSEAYNKNQASLLFCTNAPQNGNRFAYFRYGTTIYDLAKIDSASNFDKGAITSGTTDYTTTPTTGARSCTFFNGNVYFSSSYAMTSNETPDAAATYIYRCDGKYVYYRNADSDTWTSVNLDCDTIYALAVSYDYLLAGTYSGIIHTKWSSRDSNDLPAVPSAGNQDFSTNAASTLSSYYEIPTVVVVNPALTETGGTIFASSITSSTSASLNNVGLWSYFASEGEWNRE